MMQLPENFNDLICDYLAAASREPPQPLPWPTTFGAMIASAVFVHHSIRCAELGDAYESTDLEEAIYGKLMADLCGSTMELMGYDCGLAIMAKERYNAIRLVAAKCMECGGMDGDE